MTSSNKRYILKAAKDSVKKKYSGELEELTTRIEKVENTKGHLDEDGKCPNKNTCATCDEVDKLWSKYHEINGEWREWKNRRRENKKKLGKRVEWTDQRELAPARTINRAALREIRAERRKTNKPQVGIAWLHEGALVTKRGSTEMMIVTQLGEDGRVEVLHAGTTGWHRGVSLRPASWLTEE